VSVGDEVRDPASEPGRTIRALIAGRWDEVAVHKLVSSHRRTRKSMRDAQILADVAIGKEAAGGTAASAENEPLAFGPYLDHRTPQFLAYSTELVAINVARSDNNRVNAIFAAPVFYAQGLGNLADYEIPLMQIESVPVHGMRRLDIKTNYVSLSNNANAVVTQDVLGIVESYRERMRDFYCLNHLYLNGTINFGHGRPDIRVGGRLTILDPGSVAYQQSAEGMFEFYVEGVAHTWSLHSGLRTTLSVSRGWKGDHEGHLRGLRNTIVKFGRILPSVPPGV
jgi:hypothetical protein